MTAGCEGGPGDPTGEPADCANQPSDHGPDRLTLGLTGVIENSSPGRQCVFKAAQIGTEHILIAILQGGRLCGKQAV